MSDTAEDVKAEASLLAHLAEVRRQGKTLVVGVDEMERLKGIPLKLIAYEEFLRNNAEHNVVFVGTGMPGINGVLVYRTTIAHDTGDVLRGPKKDHLKRELLR